MLENININGAQVSAELHGFMYQGVYGYSGIYNFDNNCEAVIQSNNEIQLKSGLIVNKGRFLRIKGTESVMIQNGSSGVNRTDLIVARFTTDGINEKHTLAVIKGTSESMPSYTNGDIYNGATTCELPLYAVHLTGTKVDTVKQVCDTIYSDYQNITYNLSNENQVINGNFAINQRGQTTYNNDTWTNAYTVDRWMSAKSKVDVNSNGTVTITSLSTNGSSVWFKQLLEKTIEGACTLSCEVTSVTGDVYLFSQDKGIKVKQGINKITLSDLKQASFELKQGAIVTLKWVKLEQGTVATPFVAPNMAEELVKCKRFTQYYDSIPCIPGVLYVGNTTNATSGWLPLYQIFSPSMRVVPTISVFGISANNGNSIGGNYSVYSDKNRLKSVIFKEANNYHTILINKVLLDAEIY